jgi:hypothetical protein
MNNIQADKARQQESFYKSALRSPSDRAVPAKALFGQVAKLNKNKISIQFGS